MKVWGVWVCLVCALAAALAVPGAALGQGGRPQGVQGVRPGSAKDLTVGNFELKGSNGYAIKLAFIRIGRKSAAEIGASRGRLSASYEVPEKAKPGIHASFGPVGQIGMGFHRREHVVKHLGKGCIAVEDRGIFRGSFEFAGEGGYTGATTRAVKGKLLRFPDGLCFLDERAAKRTTLGGLFGRATSLVAKARTASGSVELRATKLDQAKGSGAGLAGPEPKTFGGLGVTATLQEKVGAMKIVRTAMADPTKAALTVDSGKPPGSADLQPPPPFAGSAHFAHSPGSPPTWTGDLSVSLPGAPQVPLTGAGFVAKVCPHKIFLLQGCSVSLPGGGTPQL